MTCNFLKLNSDKTKVIVLGPKHVRSRLSDNILSLEDMTLSSSTTASNLGVIFELSFIPHITQVSRTGFFHLRNIAQIRSILSQHDAEKLVHAFVTPRLDYWLLVKSRIDFKILLLTYKAPNGLSPLYLHQLIVPYIPKRTLTRVQVYS